MARNRQRAKQRKARQRAQGQAAQGGQPADAAADESVDAEAGQPAKPEVAKAQAKPTKSSAPAPAKQKADAAPRERGRVSGFFRSVWAELKRVQWPDRRQVSTLTGVVIGFVIIAGAYLGLIDAIAKKIVDLTIF